MMTGAPKPNFKTTQREERVSVVACVILQCIPCFYECKCMSKGVFFQFVSQVFNLMVIQIKVRQRFTENVNRKRSCTNTSLSTLRANTAKCVPHPEQSASHICRRS